MYQSITGTLTFHRNRQLPPFNRICSLQRISTTKRHILIIADYHDFQEFCSCANELGSMSLAKSAQEGFFFSALESYHLIPLWEWMWHTWLGSVEAQPRVFFFWGDWGSPSGVNFANPLPTLVPVFRPRLVPPGEVCPRKFEKFKYIFVSNLTTFKLKRTLKSCISCLK